MKKLRFVRKLFLICFFVFAVGIVSAESTWDQEDKVNLLPGDLVKSSRVLDNNGSIIDVDQHTFDFGIKSPVNSYNVAIYFKNAILLNEFLTLGLYGFFNNNLTGSSDVNNKTYHIDPVKFTKNALQSEEVFKQDSWSSINNTLFIYLAIKNKAPIDMGLFVGGGSSIDSFTKKYNDYTKTYQLDGKTLAAGYTNETIEQFNGSGFFTLGYGLKTMEKLYKNTPIKELSFNFRLRLDFGDSGKNDTKLITYNDLKQNVKTNYTDNKNFYFQHQYNLNFFLLLDLTKDISIFKKIEAFNFIAGVNASIGLRHYIGYENKSGTNYNLADSGYLANEYYSTTTSREYEASLGVYASIPVGLELTPVKAVEMKISYVPTLTWAYTKYSQTGKYSDLQNAVNTSFTDPAVKTMASSLTISNDVGFRFRFVFPKVVRLSLGASYSVTTTIVGNGQIIDDVIRDMAVGADVQHPYLTIRDNLATLGSTAHTINPLLELDFEIVEKYAVLTIGWQPLVNLNQGAATTDAATSASNILNLANWNLSCIVKFK